MGLTTNQLAEQLGLRPDSLRVALCRNGAYYGVRPQKFPNGRLVWPHDAYDRIARYVPSAEAFQ